jgi:hypothetical protein
VIVREVLPPLNREHNQLDEIALDLYGLTDREERENVIALGAPRN